MDPLLRAIRLNPLDYLPEASLQALQHFRSGYGFRCAMEGSPYDREFDRVGFWDWLAERYHLKGARAIDAFTVISSFSANEAEAFHKYFELLEEFCATQPARVPTPEPKPDRMDFAGLLKAIRQRPAMYLGYPSFRALRAYLAGDDRAYRDLQLSEDEGRNLIRGFSDWIEGEKNNALARPWFKVIEFWSGGMDCGHDPKAGAFSLFFRWLDAYAANVGRPEFFGAAQAGV
jgi:hypothetical protein